MRSIEVLFSPAEFEALTPEDLYESTCVVFDILRATSSIVTALHHGAHAIVPVQTIEEAVDWKRRESSVLLAGEREGYRIGANLSGGVDFDLGNSPREFTAERVAGRTIVTTTTNGTRALKACRGAMEVLAGSFLNLGATAEHLRGSELKDLVIICSGTRDEAAFEDTLAAGALVDALWALCEQAHVADSAQIARVVYQKFENDLAGAMSCARNGRRLLSIPDLSEDVAYCLRRDACPLVACLEAGQRILRISGSAAKGK